MGSNTKILREQIDFLNRKYFGPKSEKTAALTGRIPMHEVFEHGHEHGQFDEEDTEADLEAGGGRSARVPAFIASRSSVVWAMFQKYLNHVLLYPQEKDWHNLCY